MVDGDEETKEMSETQNAAVEWIIANTIRETPRGDSDALAARIIARFGASRIPHRVRQEPHRSARG
jgi:hypothetical protein